MFKNFHEKHLAESRHKLNEDTIGPLPHGPHHSVLLQHGFSHISSHSHRFKNGHSKLGKGGIVTTHHYEHPDGKLAHTTHIDYHGGNAHEGHTLTTVNHNYEPMVGSQPEHFDNANKLKTHLKHTER